MARTGSRCGRETNKDVHYPLEMKWQSLSPLLEDMDDLELRSWMSNWSDFDKICDMILSLPSDVFWSMVVHDEKVVRLIDNFCESFPWSWETTRLELYLKRNDAVTLVASTVFKKILFILLRAVLPNENRVNDEDSFLRIIYDYRIITVDRLVNVAGVYDGCCEDAVRALFERTIVRQPLFASDLSAYSAQLVRSLEGARDNLRFFVLECVNEGNGTKIMSHLAECTRYLEAAMLLFKYCPSSKKHLVDCDLAVVIPALVEDFTNHLTPASLQSMVTSVVDFPISQYLQAFDQLRMSAWNLFNVIITDKECWSSKTVVAIQNGLLYENFIYYYNILFPIDSVIAELLAKGFCDSASVAHIQSCLGVVSSSEENKLIEKLRNQGLLQSLGSSTVGEVQTKIKDILELLPHFSPQFIHLCLRHFGYDQESTVNALLGKFFLPLELRALLSSPLEAMDPPCSQNQLVIFPPNGYFIISFAI
ncbi:hypothetical protein AB6A40_003298 [Gnathostoma spinigerum]|uniref:CUE domain-containing protein n=1 Tax=Gnathostoma spinigerum TaxID=75299 RepID=A0ABD6E965_9BILA